MFYNKWLKKNLIIGSIVLSGNNLINGCGKCGVTSEALAKKLYAYCMNDKDLNISNNTLSIEDASLFLETFKKFVKLTELCTTNDNGESYTLNTDDENNLNKIKALFSENGEKIFGNTFIKKMLALIGGIIKKNEEEQAKRQTD